MKMLGIVGVGVVRESRKFPDTHVYGALRGHLCDSTAFLLHKSSLDCADPKIAHNKVEL